MSDPESYGYQTSPPEPTPPALEKVSTTRSIVSTVKATFSIAPVTVVITAVTVTIWLLHVAIAHLTLVNTDLTLGDPGTAIHGQPWRLVTPMVVHFGVLHLGLNMLVLWRLGPSVEQIIGSRKFLAAYLLTGVGGQIASDLVVGTKALSGGASGAIYGIIGVLIGYALAARVATRRGRTAGHTWTINPGAVKSLAIQAGLWLVVGGAIAHVDSAAHAGGAVVGLLFGGHVAWHQTTRAAAPSAE
ncbi:MAG: hypothetical protein NVS3B21_06580 [Acidimicrobiales bacterium]